MPSEEWIQHFQMRKEQGYSCSKRSQQIAINQLTRLEKEGFHPQLLLNYATDRLYRSFHRWPECLKPRPVFESPRMTDLAKSDPEKAKEFMKLLKNITKPVKRQTYRERKLELLQQVVQYNEEEK